MAKGKEHARANGDRNVERVNSVAKGGDEAVNPISQSADARLQARGNSSDGCLNLDE
jgi:hypothetical protein